MARICSIKTSVSDSVNIIDQRLSIKNLAYWIALCESVWFNPLTNYCNDLTLIILTLLLRGKLQNE
jgi:hypothetical protein